MKQCYLTLRKKFTARYGRGDLSMREWAYFAFHTPFSKMVQKSFLALILADIEVNYGEVRSNQGELRYDRDLVE